MWGNCLAYPPEGCVLSPFWWLLTTSQLLNNSMQSPGSPNGGQTVISVSMSIKQIITFQAPSPQHDSIIETQTVETVKTLDCTLEKKPHLWRAHDRHSERSKLKTLCHPQTERTMCAPKILLLLYQSVSQPSLLNRSTYFLNTLSFTKWAKLACITNTSLKSWFCHT